MQNYRVPSILVVTAALIAIATACDDGPTRPSSQDGYMRSLAMTGPATIAPGEVARFTLTATMAVGGQRDLTDEAVWRSSAPSMMSVNKGVGTGLALGESFISAVISGRTTTKPVVVTPAGTFRVRGSVMQANSNTGIAGATVEARAPNGDVQETVTSTNGAFVLYGVHAAAELVVRHPLYDEQRQGLSLTDHGVVNVQLAPNAGNPAINGRYTLTIGSSECPGVSSTTPALPGHMRQRTYTAVIALQSNGRSLQVTLEGATFGPRRVGIGNQFYGLTQGGRVTFTLWGPDDWYYYYYAVNGPDVIEQMDDGTYLIYSGNATLDFSGTGLQGRLTGAMRNARTPDSSALLARCSGSFPMTLSR